MSEKLEAGLYRSVAEWQRDVELIVSNCKAYNHASSGIVASAKKFQAHIDSMRSGQLYHAAAAAAAAAGGGGGVGAAMEE